MQSRWGIRAPQLCVGPGGLLSVRQSAAETHSAASEKPVLNTSPLSAPLKHVLSRSGVSHPAYQAPEMNGPSEEAFRQHKD